VVTDKNNSSTPDKTLWGELHKKVWSDSIKPFLDFRAYLNQRREIVRHPDLQFAPDRTSSAEWKTPLGFAIQGVLVTLLIIKALGWSFSAVFRPPEKTELYIEFTSDTKTEIFPQKIPVGESIWKFRSTLARKDLAQLTAELQRIRNSNNTQTFRGPVQYSTRPIPTAFFLSAGRNDAEKEYTDEIANVERQLNTYEFMENYEFVSKVVKDYSPAVTFFLAAYIFLLIVDRQLFPSGR
jgi:hypothetical protein